MGILAAHGEAATAAGASRPAFPEQIAEQVRERADVLKTRGRAVSRRVFAAGVFPVVALLRPLLAAGVDLAEIETAALVRVAQDVIGRGDLLELLLGGLIAGIEVRMQLLGELAVSLGDVLGSCGLRDAEN